MITSTQPIAPWVGISLFSVYLTHDAISILVWFGTHIAINITHKETNHTGTCVDGYTISLTGVSTPCLMPRLCDTARSPAQAHAIP